MSGITEVTGLSLNCRWPGFGSTLREARPWSARLPDLVRGIRAVKPDVLMLQEAGDSKRGGQVGAVADALGWKYQALILNGLAWDDSRFDYVSTQDIVLPDGGQWPGRSCPVVKLREKRTGNRLRIGSLHLAVKTNSPTVSEVSAKALRALQMQRIVSKLNDDADDWPMFLAGDFNSRAADTGRTPRTIAADPYGWKWPETMRGIDMVMSNYRAHVDTWRKVEMGTATDHDGVLFTGHTNKK